MKRIGFLAQQRSTSIGRPLPRDDFAAVGCGWRMMTPRKVPLADENRAGARFREYLRVCWGMGKKNAQKLFKAALAI
jgi:hypothetical protein